MNKDIIEGKWKQIKGDVQQKWAKLTDDDLEQIDGSREKFLGKIQETYGVARKDAEEQLQAFEDSLAA